MKKRILLTIFAAIFSLALIAQSNPFSEVKQKEPSPSTADDCNCSLLMYGPTFVTFGQTKVYGAYNPQPGHTFLFDEVIGGVILGTTATSVTVLWTTPGYSYGCVHMRETDENGCSEPTSRSVVIGI